jgi:hypothetical protein
VGLSCNNDGVLHWQVAHGNEPLLNVAEKIKQIAVAHVARVKARVESRIKSVCEDGTTVGVDVNLAEVSLDCRDDSVRADTLRGVSREQLGLVGRDKGAEVTTSR